MKIVNKSNVPEVLFNALEANWYHGQGEKRDWSVTEIMKPLRVAILGKRYDNLIEQDGISNMWSMMGSAMHNVLEKGSSGKEHLNILVEKRVKTIIDGNIISGGLDVYDENKECVIDFKFQTIWNWVNLDDHIDDLTFQLNMYKFLLRRNGYKVSQMKVIFLFRDWREYEISRYNGYPDTQWKELNIEDIPEEDLIKMVSEKIKLLTKYYDEEDDKIPVCSMKERWQDPTAYKAISPAGKCTRILSSMEEAEEFISGKDFYTISVEEKKPKRCEKYCAAHDYCDFYREHVKDKEWKN